MKKKRHVLLLEVLIALAIVTLCILPLLHPHVAILSEEKSFVREIELDRLVGLIHSDMLVEQFYRENIQWWTIEQDQPIEITDDRLDKLGFRGSYSFKRKLRKSKMEDGMYLHNLVSVIYAFTPTQGGDPLSYSYDLYVTRNIVGEKEDKDRSDNNDKSEKKNEQT